MSLRFFIFFCCLSFSQLVYSTNSVAVNFNDEHSTFNAVIKQLQKNTLIRSQFKQSRKLKILKKPLISKGQIIFFSGTGIIWEINQPVKSKTIITNNKITEITSLNGDETITSNPNTAGFYNVLESILSGNIKEIRKHFTARFSGDINNWVISLTPTTNPLNKIFTQIRLSGVQQINSIVFNDYNNDITRIELITPQENPQSMTKKEAAYFAL